ncbi:hypothetical protein ACWXWU_03360 [Shewanella sp. A14]
MVPHSNQLISSLLTTFKSITLLLTLALTLTPTHANPQLLLTKSNHDLFGNWIIDTPEQITLLQLNPDLSYLHIEFNLLKPQNSVAEWGRIDIHPSGVRFIPSYSSNQQQGLVAYQIAHPKLHIALTVESARLVFNIDTNADSVVDEQHDYQAYPMQSIYGVWHQQMTSALSSLLLLDNGYYAVVNINLHQDPQTYSHYTHLQWGHFDIQQHQLFINPIFDNHPQQSVSHLGILQSIFYHQRSQQLALSFDSDKDNLSDRFQLFTR